MKHGRQSWFIDICLLFIIIVIELNRLLNNKPGYVYVMQDRRTGLVKLGFSIDPKQRLDTLRVDIPDLQLIKSYRFSSENKARRFENKLHKLFAGQKQNYPVKCSGYTEFFKLRIGPTIRKVDELYGDV